ncbi:MAG: hypothetical protein SNJ71_00370 [Bacteroidales bacterium]
MSLDFDISSFAERSFLEIFNLLSKNCEIFYPGTFIDCAHCNFDTIGQKPGNFFLDGSRLTTNPICPSCGGQGKKFIQKSEIIKMTINVSLKQWDIRSGNIRLPDSIIETRVLREDVPKILKCDYAVIDVDSAVFRQYKYRLYSEPINKFMIVDNFFIALWKRIES